MRPTPPFTQLCPARQPLGLQHGWPVPPHAEQLVIPTRHDDCAAVQVISSQQVSPTLPQGPPVGAWHEPALHVPANPRTAGVVAVAGMPAQVAPSAWH